MYLYASWQLMIEAYFLAFRIGLKDMIWGLAAFVGQRMKTLIFALGFAAAGGCSFLGYAWSALVGGGDV